MKTKMIVTGRTHLIGAFLNELKDFGIINGRSDEDDQKVDLLDVAEGKKLIMVDFPHLHWVAIEATVYTETENTFVYHLGTNYDNAVSSASTIVDALSQKAL